MRNKVVVVGEDLGTVEPVVRETLARFGILSYRLFYFERDESGDFRRFEEYPEQALVSSTTHDLPTLAGFWTNEDIEARRRAGVLGDEENYRAQLAARAREKQKMLDLLFAAGLLPDSLPRAASDDPGADRRAAQRRDRIPGVHAVAVAGGEPGGSDQGDCSSRICRARPGSIRTGAARCGSRWRNCGRRRSRAISRRCSGNWVERTGRMNR